jgi:hypothetical protein
VGLLKQIKGRWACLFLDFRFYLPLKTIQAKKETATIRGTVVPFQTKMTQAGDRVIGIAEHFPTSAVLVFFFLDGRTVHYCTSTGREY